MKRIGIVIVVIASLSIACNHGEKEEIGHFQNDVDAVQVVLFHLEKRCASCMAVEKETLLVLKENFSDQLEEKALSFVSLNFNGEENRAIAERLNASGQSLLIVTRDTTINLSSDAFMFAQVKPERYRATLKLEIENLMK